jgi:hypothetical protein
VRFRSTLTSQGPVPLQLPPAPPPLTFQLENVDPAAGAALSVTLVPDVKLNVQTVPQSMPLGELLTVPDPVPDLLIVSVLTFGVVLNSATTV